MADELQQETGTTEQATDDVAAAVEQAVSESGKTDAAQADERAATTLAEGQPGGDEDDAKAPADWPSDWREKLANGDEKLLKRLQRFQSPRNVLDSWRAAEQKISSGDLKAALPENPTDEQLAEYRKANGIPEAPEGYLEKLPDGLVIGEEDKDRAKSFAEIAHRHNLPPGAAGDMIAWSYKQAEHEAAEQAQADKQVWSNTEEALRAEWGNEYRANKNAITNYLESLPTDEDGNNLGDLLLSARLPNGRKFGADPAALQWLMGVINESNPAATVVPGSGTSQMQSIEDEIKRFEDMMKTNRKEYNKPENSNRYRQLIEARDKMAARG